MPYRVSDWASWRQRLGHATRPRADGDVALNDDNRCANFFRGENSEGLRRFRCACLAAFTISVACDAYVIHAKLSARCLQVRTASLAGDLAKFVSLDCGALAQAAPTSCGARFTGEFQLAVFCAARNGYRCGLPIFHPGEIRNPRHYSSAAGRHFRCRSAQATLEWFEPVPYRLRPEEVYR